VSEAGSEEQLIEWLRALKQERGHELRRRHGAHAVGIGRRRSDGHPALLLYVAPADEDAPAASEPVPEEVEFTPPGHREAVRLPVDVVLSTPPSLEADEG
jgi:hypothetical protein